MSKKDKKMIYNFWALFNLVISIACVIMYNYMHLFGNISLDVYIQMNDWYAWTGMSWAFFWIIIQKDTRKNGGKRLNFLNETTYRIAYSYVLISFIISSIINISLIMDYVSFHNTNLSGTVIAGIKPLYYSIVAFSVYIAFWRVRVPNWLKDE